MYQVFGIRKFLGWVAILDAAIFAILVLVRQPTEFVQFGSLISQSSFLCGVLIVLIGETPLFHKIWQYQWVQKFFFPYIHGEWAGQIESNWPLISNLRTAAEGKGKLPKGYAIQDSGKETKNVSLQIHATLLTLKAELNTDDKYSESVTVTCLPVSNGDYNKPSIYYVFRAKTNDKKKTDTDQFHGALSGQYKTAADGTPLLEGIYWTDRSWDKGQNTAGKITLRKQ